MEKKKIIFVISRMAIGGAQKSLINALSFFDYEKYDVTLYVRENKNELVKDVPKHVKVIVNNNNKNYNYSLINIFIEIIRRFMILLGLDSCTKKCEKIITKNVVKKRAAYEKKHYKELNFNYDIAISYLQGYTCKFTYDVISADKYICFYHNSTNSTYKLHKKYLPLYDKVVTVDENTNQLLLDQYPQLYGKLFTIHNIIVPKMISKRALEYNFPSNNRFRICSCGRISKEKGFNLAVEASLILKNQGINYEWIIIGDGPLKSEINDTIKEKGLESYFKLVGEKINPYPIIASSDLFVQSSYEESQGLAMIEAMILGCPVVTTATVGGKNTVANGLYGIVTEISPDEIARGIIELYSSKRKRENIKANLKNIDFNEYNKECLTKWESLLED